MLNAKMRFPNLPKQITRKALCQSPITSGQFMTTQLGLDDSGDDVIPLMSSQNQKKKKHKGTHLSPKYKV